MRIIDVTFPNHLFNHAFNVICFLSRFDLNRDKQTSLKPLVARVQNKCLNIFFYDGFIVAYAFEIPRKHQLCVRYD